jgi:putative transposase
MLNHSIREQSLTKTWARLQQPERPPGYVTVYRWKKRYLDSAKDVRCLVPQFHQRGNHIQRYPEEVESIVAKAIEQRYLTLEKGTIQDVVDQAIAKVAQENMLRPAAIALSVPTRRLVKRMVDAIAFQPVVRHG